MGQTSETALSASVEKLNTYLIPEAITFIKTQ